MVLIFLLLLAVSINGYVCKDPKTANENDFFGCGLHLPGNTSNALGSKVTPYNAAVIPGLNTLGVSLARIDLGPYGLNPPHLHPRGSEIITVLEGCVQVGFITSNPENRHFTRNLGKGDVFVFPMGLVHYQKNLGNASASILCAFNSQNPGTIGMANAVFGAKPAIGEDILAKTFQSTLDVMKGLEDKF